MVARTEMKDTCNLCGSRSFELIRNCLRDEKDIYKVFGCEHCGHKQLMPKPPMEDDRGFYNKNLQDKRRNKEIDFEKLKRNNQFDTERHVRLIESLCKDRNCRILDIGSGYGFFVNGLFGRQFKNVTGIEISKERREISQVNSGVKILDCNVNDPDMDISTFDIITLFHVLEHMADPIAFLRNIRKLLKRNGTLVCEVPNVNEMLLDYCKEYNDFYWIRAHLNYFSEHTLRLSFEKAGFKGTRIIYEQRYGLINLCNWLTTGKPQLEMPIFDICGGYGPIEEKYREWLKSIQRTDTLIAIGGIGQSNFS